MSNSSEKNITTCHTAEELVRQIRPKGFLAGGSFFIDEDSFVRRVRGAPVKIYNPFELYRKGRPKSIDQPHIKFLLLYKVPEAEILNFYNQFGELGFLWHLGPKEWKRRFKAAQMAAQDPQDPKELGLLLTAEPVDEFRRAVKDMRWLAYLLKYIEDGKTSKLREHLSQVDIEEKTIWNIVSDFSLSAIILGLKVPGFPSKQRYSNADLKRLIAETDNDSIPCLAVVVAREMFFNKMLGKIKPTISLSENHKVEATFKYCSLLSCLYFMLWLDLGRKTLDLAICERPDCEQGLFIRTGRQLKYCSDRCARIMATRRWRGRGERGDRRGLRGSF